MTHFTGNLISTVSRKKICQHGSTHCFRETKGTCFTICKHLWSQDICRKKLTWPEVVYKIKIRILKRNAPSKKEVCKNRMKIFGAAVTSKVTAAIRSRTSSPLHRWKWKLIYNRSQNKKPGKQLSLYNLMITSRYRQSAPNSYFSKLDKISMKIMQSPKTTKETSQFTQMSLEASESNQRLFRIKWLLALTN